MEGRIFFEDATVRKEFFEGVKSALALNSWLQVAKWMDLIGFSNERHLSKIKLLEKSKPKEGFEPSTYSLPRNCATRLCHFGPMKTDNNFPSKKG